MRITLTLKLFVAFIALYLLQACQKPAPAFEDVYKVSKEHIQDLRFSVYITAHTVDRLLSLEEGRREALSLLHANGITKVYIEVYRSGLVVRPELLAEVKDFFVNNGFEVVGGIATVPGGDFGVAQEGKLGWFNWQNEKTQNDLRQVMLDAAPIFDTFIVDDFLCTGDTSLESKSAKGDRSWSVYRRELLTELATSIFIEPAKSVNPDIHMIIKYPQWYDRFHMFGYDVESGPRLFDEVWVGTETRGQYTQRFGFVQPYEGFVNYQWISTLAGDKIGGAWFDHGDCDALDFIEQAYQSVLAGANEIVIFNYGSFVQGHPGHHQLRMDMEKLFTLASAVKSNPVVGIPAYKPPHSDAEGDLYIMDLIGMLGIPLIPVSAYPDEASTIFLPAQAASDPDIISKIWTSKGKGSRIIATSGFIAKVKDDGRLAELAGISKPVVKPSKANQIMVGGTEASLDPPLDLDGIFEVGSAESLLESSSGIPFLTRSEDQSFYVLNSHTFSEQDFEAVGEVLLCPRPLGILEVPDVWVNTIRSVFNHELPVHLHASTRVTMQPLANGELIIHNYNQEKTAIKLSGISAPKVLDVFSGKGYDINNQTLELDINARSRVWLRPSE
ncbi:MAG: hypothetical protein ACFHWX_05260 [Bacteroidota bacterium]